MTIFVGGLVSTHPHELSADPKNMFTSLLKLNCFSLLSFTANLWWASRRMGGGERQRERDREGERERESTGFGFKLKQLQMCIIHINTSQCNA